MELGKHVVDKEILDRTGLRAGKVDDLLLDLGDPAPDGTPSPPTVSAIIAGPLALSRNLPRPLALLARWVYRLLGVHSPRPVLIPWTAVTAIDVVVHTDIDRDEAGLTALQQAVARRFIGRLPGA
jgi:sporulation protein YlmC with PRC-barrel domain